MNKTNCLEWETCLKYLGDDLFYRYETGEPNLHCEDCGDYKPNWKIQSLATTARKQE